MNERISPAQIEEAKAVDLPTLIGAHVKLTRRGREWWGCCPFHKEKSPSFHVTRDFYKCFGCGASGDAISWVRESEHLQFAEAIARLTRSDAPARFCGVRTKPSAREDDTEKRKHRAETIWNAGQPISGTLAEQYLRARGIRAPQSAELRFLPSTDHSESGTSCPAVLGRISDERGLCAVQRTYLAADGSKKADVKPNKKTLGPMEGGAVRLRAAGELLGLAEGIETAMSAAQLYQVATWATLSAQRLQSIDIPETVRSIIIFADQGEVGMREAVKACDAYEARGYGVEIIAPAADFAEAQAGDFNDVVRGIAA